MGIRSVLAFLFITIIGSSSASVRKINSLKDKISNQQTSINKLAAQVRDLDLKISTNNDKFLERVKEIDNAQMRIERVKKNLNLSANDISNEYKLTKIAFNHYILESVDNESDESLHVQSVYLDLLKKKLKSLDDAQLNSKKLLDNLHSFEKSLAEKKDDEESVYRLIVDLENKKKDMSQSYISLMENKDLNQNKLDKLVAKKKAFKKIRRKRKKSSGVLFKLGIPLDLFVDAKKTKEGITFKYTETTPIKAPREGRVVYTGELASYGKVLIIDHGQDVRSVILGDMVSKVKKGDFVKNEQIVGYTISDPAVQKSLYYEVRKKNIAQDTVKWLSKNKKNKLKI